MAQHRANGEAGARQVLRSLIGPVYAPTLFQAVGMTAILPVIPLIALSLGFPVPAAAAITMITGIVGVLGPIPLASVMTVVGERRAMIATGILVALTQVGSLLLIVDATVVLFAVLVFRNIEVALYSIVTIFATTRTIDAIMQGVDHAKVIYIVTERGEDILALLADDLGHSEVGLFVFVVHITKY